MDEIRNGAGYVLNPADYTDASEPAYSDGRPRQVLTNEEGRQTIDPHPVDALRALHSGREFSVRDLPTRPRGWYVSVQPAAGARHDIHFRAEADARRFVAAVREDHA
jgi:hypothetical protein